MEDNATLSYVVKTLKVGYLSHKTYFTKGGKTHMSRKSLQFQIGSVSNHETTNHLRGWELYWGKFCEADLCFLNVRERVEEILSALYNPQALIERTYKQSAWIVSKGFNLWSKNDKLKSIQFLYILRRGPRNLRESLGSQSWTLAMTESRLCCVSHHAVSCSYLIFHFRVNVRKTLKEHPKLSHVLRVNYSVVCPGSTCRILLEWNNGLVQ